MTPAAEALVLANLKLVDQIAGRIAKRVPSNVEMDDLVSAGNLGLVEAANRFDPQRHASFPVFARMYIGGRIIDSVRGPQYPRRWEQIPEAWVKGIQANADGRDESTTLPERLIDRTSPLEVLIEQQECVVVSIEAYRARTVLDPQEGKVLDKHLKGQRLTVIGKKHKKSACWAHTKLKIAKKKMRAELEAFRRDVA